MKKNLFAVLLFAGAGLLSCRQESTPAPTPAAVSQTVNVSVANDGTYTYTIPAGPGPVAMTTVTQAPAHASLSVITTDAQGNTIYQYKPEANYAGTDVAAITTTPPPPPPGGCNGGHGNGNCGGNGGHNGCNHQHPGAPKVVNTTFNITVTTAQTATAARQAAEATVHK